MNLTLIVAAITAAAAGAAGFGAAWTLQGRTIDAIKLEDKDAIISQQRAARTVADRLAVQVITAQNVAAASAAVQRADAGRAGDAGSGLRIASADTLRAANASASACAASVAKFDLVLGEISRAAEGLAVEADGWERDALMFQALACGAQTAQK